MDHSTLSLFLNNQSKDFSNQRPRTYHQDLSTSLSIGLILTHQKLKEIHPRLHTTTVTNRNRLEVLKLILDNFQPSIISVSIKRALM